MHKTLHLRVLLAVACAPVVTFAQQQAEHWKEYAFAEDGFAITLPEAPKVFTDAHLAEITDYNVPMAMLTLRVSHQNRDCSNTLGQLRNSASQGKSGEDLRSIREISIEDHPGLEYQWRREGSYGSITNANRYYCVNGKFYMFATSWRTGHAESEAAKKAIDSFRLLPVVAAQDKPPLSSASNTTEPDSQQAYRVSGDIKPPRVISRNEPNYPQQARKGQAAGPIVIWMIVDSDGGTRDIHVHHGISPELDHAAVEAVEKWRFEPATTEGKPVSVRIAIQFDFQP